MAPKTFSIAFYTNLYAEVFFIVACFVSETGSNPLVDIKDDWQRFSAVVHLADFVVDI